MMFVKTAEGSINGPEFYLNAAKIEGAKKLDAADGKTYAVLQACGGLFYASIDGFGSFENFIQVLGEEPAAFEEKE